MFSLLYGFWEYLTRKEELRILILGLDKAGAPLAPLISEAVLPKGKTSLLERLKTTYTDLPGLEADKILPTVGLNVGRMEAFKSLLMFWDLGGQTGLRSIWDKYFADSHAVIFVVDSSCPERLEEAKGALERVLGSLELFDAPLLVAANKQDVVGALSALEIQEHFGLGKVDARPTRVQPVSSLRGEGISDGIRWLLTEIHRSSRCSRFRQRRPRS